jgi:hypothetical protein
VCSLFVTHTDNSLVECDCARAIARTPGYMHSYSRVPGSKGWHLFIEEVVPTLTPQAVRKGARPQAMAFGAVQAMYGAYWWSRGAVV